jgi:hypothetical protein
VRELRDVEAHERGDADEEARARPRDGNAELGARIVWLAPETGESAERVQHYLVALDAFGAREQSVRKLVAED